MTLEQALIAALASLTTVILVLWRLHVANLARCLAERDRLWAEILRQYEGGCIRQPCEIRLPGEIPVRKAEGL